MITQLKNYIYAVVIVFALIVGGVYYYQYSQVKKSLDISKAETKKVIAERDNLIAINKKNDETIKQLLNDKKALEDTNAANKDVEKNAKIKYEDRIVYIDRIVNLDPKTNNREVSPVIKDTIADIQKGWGKEK